RLHKAAHQAPLSTLRLEAALDKQQLQMLTVEAENDAIHGYQKMFLSRVTSHIASNIILTSMRRSEGGPGAWARFRSQIYFFHYETGKIIGKGLMRRSSPDPGPAPAPAPHAGSGCRRRLRRPWKEGQGILKNRF